jgi:hypothetical protein
MTAATPEELNKAWENFVSVRAEFHNGQMELRSKMEAAFKEFQEVKNRR